jgi:acyl-CoA dehydrogenase
MPFAEISDVTMVPVSYVLWSAAWLGIATAAVERAQHFLSDGAGERAAMTAIGAFRLAELTAKHQQMAELIDGAARQVDAASDDPTLLANMRFAIAMNNLKTTASTLLIQIVSRALAICGMDGYRLDTTHSMSRLLRDACGATLMVNNDGITARSAEMLMVAKES